MDREQRPGEVLGRFERLLGAMLGRSWAHARAMSGRSGVALRPCRAILGPRCWRHPAPPQGYRGPSWGPKGVQHELSGTTARK